MDKLSIFNNEELLEVYDKIQEEIDHLNSNIIIEEDEVEEQPEETPTGRIKFRRKSSRGIRKPRRKRGRK